MSNDNGKLTKNERRQQAREQARIAREREKKREKRNRLFLQGGIAIVVLAVLAVVAIVLTQTLKPAGPGPKNMASGGVVFTKDLKVVEGPALKSGEQRKAAESNDFDKLPVEVEVFADYMCPACGSFDQQYSTMLENYVGAGDVNLEVYPINFLDTSSMGTKYSTRAANMFSCVVEQQPDYAFKLHNLLLSADVQPEEGTEGLTDEQLLDQAKAAGATVDDDLKQCVKDQRFAAFIDGNTKQATETGVLGLADGERLLNTQQTAAATGEELQTAGEPQRLVQTPLVIVNGKQWDASRDGDLEQYILKVKGELESKADKQASESSDDSSSKTDDDTASKKSE